MGCKGYAGEFLLAMAMLLAMAAFFTWAMAAPELMSLPVILGAMVVTALGLIVVARKVHQSEKGVLKAGRVAEEHGGDPIAPVTKTARSGCGTAFAWLSVLAVCGVLAAIASMLTGGT